MPAAGILVKFTCDESELFSEEGGVEQWLGKRDFLRVETVNKALPGRDFVYFVFPANHCLL